ncbi:MAG: multidrug ABC transporter ATP-binding protein [Bacteroidia bacterium]|nr:MAG: multidrug ABC transporter ATP-binding protein [Bacteroidia bacterium]
MAKSSFRVRSKEKDEIPKVKLSWVNIRKSFYLFSYLGQEKWKFIAGMVFLFGTATVGLIFPLVSGKMIGYFGETGLSADEMKRQLFDIGKILLGILILQGFFSFMRVYFFSQVTESILKKLRDEAFSKIIRMPMDFFYNNQSAELSSRIATDINVISDAFTINIAEFIRQSIIAIGGTVLLFYYTSWEIIKWFILMIPSLILITIVFGKRIRNFSKHFQDLIAESNVIVGEAFTGILSVKSFSNEWYEIKRYTNKTGEVKKQGIKYGILRGMFFAFIISVIFGTVFFILWKMLLLKNEGIITAEQFGKFMMLSIFVAGSLGGLPEQIASIQRALGANDRLLQLMQQPVEDVQINLPDNFIYPKELKGDIEFMNVNFSYPSRKEFQVLKNVSFQIKAGQKVALVGSSGSGKSTIAQLILRFYVPDSGLILVDGKNYVEYDLSFYRQHIAIVPQDTMLFGGTIYDNIRYGNVFATEQEIIDAAKRANAYEFIMQFPDKFNTIVGDRGIQLSGGQRQRIAIARALLRNPSILILDEATSNLDAESEKLVQDALETLMKDRTSIIIAHRLSTIRNADKILVLKQGEIVQQGNYNELMADEDGFFYNLNKIQIEAKNVSVD